MRAEIEHKRKKPELGKSNRRREKKRNSETVKKDRGKRKRYT